MKIQGVVLNLIREDGYVLETASSFRKSPAGGIKDVDYQRRDAKEQLAKTIIESFMPDWLSERLGYYDRIDIINTIINNPKSVRIIETVVEQELVDGPDEAQAA